MANRITRSVKLLNYIQNDNGLTKFYSELDSGLIIGDYVYFSGGNYDNSSTSYNNSFNPFSNKKYVVKSINNNDNSFTLNITYTGTNVQIADEDVFISRTCFITGQIAYPNIGDGIFGRLYKTNDLIIGTSVIPSPIRNINPVYLYQGIFNGGEIKQIQWAKYAFSGPVPSINSNKVQLANIPIKVAVGANNDGFGYSLFRSGIFGSSNYGLNFIKWNNGKFYGGIFENGIWYNGEMSSIYDICSFVTGTWNNGIAKDVIWYDGTWLNGSWYGANNINIISMSINGGNLRCVVEDKYLELFSNGDDILLTGILGTGQTVDGDSDYNNYIATVNNSNPLSDGYIQFTYPSSVLPLSFNYINAKITFSKFIKGNFSGGIAYNGVFGNTGLTADTDINFIGTGYSIVFLNGYLNGTINRSNMYGSSKLYNGLYNFSNITGSSIYDGQLKDSNINECNFDGGFFINSTSIGSSIGNSLNLSSKVIWVNGTFINSIANENILWKKVNYVNGQWAYPASYLQYMIPNTTYINYGTITTMQLPIAGNQTYNIIQDNLGTLKTPAVATALRLSPYFVDVSLGDPIGVIEYNGTSYLNGYKYLASGDITNIDSANLSVSWQSPSATPVINTNKTLLNASTGTGRTNYEIYKKSTDSFPDTWLFRIALDIGSNINYGPTTILSFGVATLCLEIDIDETSAPVTQLPPEALEITNILITKDSGGGPITLFNMSGSYKYTDNTQYSYPWNGLDLLTVPNIGNGNVGDITFSISSGDTIAITINYITRNTYNGIKTADTISTTFLT